MMPGDPLVGGVALRRPAIQSPNYVTGMSGWTINADGSAEFNNLTIRGTFMGTDFEVNSSGAFFYNGTPAAGNLDISIAQAAGTDQFGNAYPAGVTAGLSTATQARLVSVSGSGVLDFPLNNALFVAGVLKSGIIGNFASLTLAGPQKLVANLEDLVFLDLNSSDGVASSANLECIYVDTSGGTHLYAYMNYQGFRIQACSELIATQPGTGTSSLNPAQAETWHTLGGFVNGWSGTVYYRLMPDNTVQMTGTLTPGTAADGTAFAGVPAGYIPASHSEFVPVGWYGGSGAPGGRPMIQVDTAGHVRCYGCGGVSGGTLPVSGRYPLDAP